MFSDVTIIALSAPKKKLFVTETLPEKVPRIPSQQLPSKEVELMRSVSERSDIIMLRIPVLVKLEEIRLMLPFPLMSSID